jgi:uncharacterized membrane protein YozB (DUF420 family)
MTIELQRLLFWSAATGLMAMAVVSALRGFARIRDGRIAEHRKEMNRAVLLVAAFLVAYLAKVAWLGHESLAVWSPQRVAVLNVHRNVVFLMLGAGAVARWLGPQVAAGRRGWRRAVHRWAGRCAVVIGSLGLLSALIVLVQMFAARGSD